MGNPGFKAEVPEGGSGASSRTQQTALLNRQPRARAREKKKVCWARLGFQLLAQPAQARAPARFVKTRCGKSTWISHINL